MYSHYEMQKEVGKNIANAVRKSGCTTGELSKMVGFKSNPFHNWYAGINYPAMKYAVEIADVLGISPKEFLFGKDEPKASAVISRVEIETMRDLHRGGTIDDEVYYLWLEKRLMDIAE